MCYLNLFRENSKFKSVGQTAPETKIEALGPCVPPVPPPVFTAKW